MVNKVSIMAPIRIGFIGLSKTGWATTAHIPYLSSSSKFKIVAICNSSVQSAREAVELYKLPADTATYGDPEGSRVPHPFLRNIFLF
jgi:predicted dehydrogenase